MTNTVYDLGDIIEYRPRGFASLRRVRVLRHTEVDGQPGFVGEYVGSGIRGEVIPQGEVSGRDGELVRIVKRA